jgi:UV DNA damage endonuclease
MLSDWDPFPVLAGDFAELGDYVKQHEMRVSFHPDHFTVLSTPRPEVLASSRHTLDYHVRMLEAMGLDERARLNIHIGGTYGDREKALVRFCDQFTAMDDRLKRRITLENDDKTYTALETLQVCEQLRVPMVLDLHHHMVNGDGEPAVRLWPRILDTWRKSPYAPDSLPPKIHISSPKNDKEPRAHADYVELGDILPFLRDVAAMTPQLDVMIEAKRKDDALLRLIDDLKTVDGIELVDQSSVLIRA